MRYRAFILLILSVLYSNVNTSYCGANGVPYSLEILSDGSPVLGCAQPTCMAEPTEDVEDSVFIANAAGQEDGFFREGDRHRRSYSQSFKPRAECPGTFSDLACTKKNQWVGGIDFIDHPRQPLTLQCCVFEGLRFSQDVGITTIAAGEAVTGGEVIREGRQISFDVIANVRKLVDPEDPKKNFYEVTVRRMNCLPDPLEFEVEYDDDVEAEIKRVLGNATNSAMTAANELHVAQERKLSKRPYKRKPKTSSVHNVVSPLDGHDDGEKRGRSEPFIGSFGAPIFNPTAEHKSPVQDVEATTSTKNPYTRKIVTPKPRQTTIRVESTTAAPVTVHVEAQPTAATPLPNPFEFHPLPPFPQFALPQPNLMFAPFPPQPPAPPLPAPFGVQHLQPLQPIPPPFGLYGPQAPVFSHSGYGLNPQPIQAPTYGLQPLQQPQQQQQQQQQQNEQFNDLDVYTKSLLTNPSSPFLMQFPQMNAAPPSPQFLTPQQGVATQNTFNPPQLQRVSIQAPQREAQSPVRLEQNVQAEPNYAPQQSHLNQIYQPPPFGALGTTLYNFQMHNG